MLYCKKCNVSINGNKKCCPLCQGKLLGEPSVEAYPKVQLPRYSKHFLIRLISFIAIAVVVICNLVNWSISKEFYWCIFVEAGVLCGWIAGIIGILYRKRLFSNIITQLFILTGMSYIWDYGTNWHGWSVDFVLPCCCVATLIAIIVLSIVQKLDKSEYVTYLIVNCIYGIVPLIFILNDSLNIVYPSIICVGICSLVLAGILLFAWHDTTSEISKKMHL